MEITEDELSDHLGGIVTDPQFAAELVFAELRAERMYAAQCPPDGVNKVERLARDLTGIPEGLLWKTWTAPTSSTATTCASRSPA